MSWLTVFDNYDNPHELPHIRDFFPESPHGAILITSRHADSLQLSTDSVSGSIEVPGLAEHDAIVLLSVALGLRDQDHDEARNIVHRLGLHPLAITQAAAYIRKRKLPLSEFLEHYRKRKSAILNHTPSISQYTKRLSKANTEIAYNVFTTWELSFQQLEDEYGEDCIETKLLTLLAFFDHKDIPESFLATVVGVSSNENLSNKTKALVGWLDHFTGANDNWSKDIFEDKVFALKDLSLLQTCIKLADDSYHLSLHPLIKDVLRNAGVNDYYIMPSSSQLAMIPHVRIQEENLQEYFSGHKVGFDIKPSYKDYLKMHSCFDTFDIQVGTYNLSHCLQALLLFQEILGQEHMFTCQAMGLLAATYRKQGNYDQAQILEEQVLELYQKNPDSTHLDKIRVTGNLAATYRCQGKHTQAQELKEQVLRCHQEMSGLKHPNTLRAMANLAVTYCDQGKYTQAQELEEQVLHCFQEVFGLEYPKILRAKENLAFTYYIQGKYNEAWELEEQTLGLSQKLLGARHPDTLRAIGILASTYYRLGQKARAISMMTEASNQLTETLGAMHPDVVACRRELTSWVRYETADAETETPDSE
ncbi:hypothetical protein MMC25_003382 [Agyrium rufum]|nr:hypothetical protein [Agyrium rufum]